MGGTGPPGAPPLRKHRGLMTDPGGWQHSGEAVLAGENEPSYG